MRYKRKWAWIGRRHFLVWLTMAAAAQAADLADAVKLFNRAQYEGSIRVVNALPAKNGPAYELLGKNYYMMADYSKATEAFEKAAAADPSNSVYFHWLGRAYGRRAETGSMFTAPSNASKARQAFERSVELDSSNYEAINDLFSYYLEAPGFLGGGLDKAQALTVRIKAHDPAEYHFALAQIAEKRKEYKSAEQNFRTAMELAPRQAGRVIDLAKFLSRHGRTEESEEILAQASRDYPNNARLVFERAANLIRAGKNLETARGLLQQYMKMGLKTDDPTLEEARKLLKAAGA